MNASKELGIALEPAQKKRVLRELATGDRNILVVIAHGTDDRLYLPGIGSGTISTRDLLSITRATAPPRVIVLISCNAGVVNARAESLVETLLRARD